MSTPDIQFVGFEAGEPSATCALQSAFYAPERAATEPRFDWPMDRLEA